MKGLFLKLYDLATEPLYRRLSREMSLQAQSLTKAQLDYQERIARKIMDELLRLNLIVQDQLGRGDLKLGSGLPDHLVPDYTKTCTTEIVEVVRELDKSLGAIEICQKHDLPIAAVLDIKSKYSRMTASSVERARNLENEKEELVKMVSDLKLENQRLRALASVKD